MSVGLGNTSLGLSSPRNMEPRHVTCDNAAMKTHLSLQAITPFGPSANTHLPGAPDPPSWPSFHPLLNAAYISHLQSKTKPNQKGEAGEQDWEGQRKLRRTQPKGMDSAR